MSQSFHSAVWNVVAHPDKACLFIELRNEELKKVTFRALDLDARSPILNEIGFEEPWWISLSWVSGSLMLLTTYNDTNNPDKKSIAVYDFIEKKIRWWRNNFTVNAVSHTHVAGVETGPGMKFLILDLQSGEPSENQSVHVLPQNFLVHKPLQYYSETAHFETVRSFLQTRYEGSPENVIEYLELDSLVFISYYVREGELANYLMVLKDNGEVLLRERIGERLKGIGVDTFFLFSGYLIFVKNKREVISYKLV